MLDGCASQKAHTSARMDFQAPRDLPKTLAVYMPWFGQSSHMDVGYSSQDPVVLRKQIAAARRMGISGFVVDWYGPRNTFIDESYATLQRVARETGFQVALMYDGPDADGGDGTDLVIGALDKAYRDYISPDAPDSEAYLTFRGRPVIFIFPKSSGTDWGRVREHVRSWAAPPLLIYKDKPPAQFASAFDGFYAWIHPGDRGWTPDGSDWGKQYLEAFYNSMQSRFPDKIAVGAAWPGFDDSHARWGLNRHMDPRCGRTLEDSLQLHRQFYDDANPLPFMLIETWNDYEEGTAIEHRDFTHCRG